MKRWNQMTLVLTAVAATCLLSFPPAHAKKPGGGPGGGDSPSKRFAVVEIPVSGTPIAVSDSHSSGVVTVAVNSGDAGYVSAAYALVDHQTKAVLSSGYLPEPIFVNTNDGQIKNGPSTPYDANQFGEIVGFASEFDPTAIGYPSPSRAVLWTPGAGGYELETLPRLPNEQDSIAFGINSWGDIVGNSSPPPGAGGGRGVAVLWDAQTHTPIDLNTQATADLGWQLWEASDVNDAGLIVGYGSLNGTPRGFVLDLVSGSIWATPLVGPATSNTAYRINQAGGVAGTAWTGDGRAHGTDPDFVQAYFWAGPGATPLILPSVTNNTSVAANLNDAGAAVGVSFIPTDDFPVNDFVPTLWEMDGGGSVVTTELAKAVTSKPSYTLRSAGGINNDGWIGVSGSRREKGNFISRALLLIPNGN